ncbi:16S rRNA (guanine(966)-N(2))-methyltransferase RsmD [Geovibrio thiophilus]|uniref:16S rRNA (Guanine(966)-N(2))-methyltransferase RsmD n=1 Tax=Geovibrio thiophilus TaxID=139438 RepID=A0A410JUP9_9BACT|nr:16S rRNA (guanine(966)-N(2))-methyltransferase RsmD [Geovibrio thiophilus]QAR31912.1 16S rRNA (guanine(966)-N(2))-methyltransferase RsmD [Geovibrio thiophilus]
MRITAGTLKGMQLHTPKNSSVRPTTDKVRQAVFSSLFDETEGAEVLDLCAGTGAFGIEAMSRGAASAVFIDLSTDIIKKNVLDSKFRNTRIIKGDIKKEIPRLTGVFNIIFIDPPYGLFLPQEIMNLIHESGILHPEGTLIYEESTRTAFPAEPEHFKVLKEKKYGETAIYYLKRMQI